MNLFKWFKQTAKYVQENPKKAELALMAAYAKGVVVGMEAKFDEE